MKLVLTAVAAITIFPTLFAKAENTDSRSVLDSVAIRCELAYQHEQEKYSSQRMLDRRKSEFEKQKEVLTRLKNADSVLSRSAQDKSVSKELIGDIQGLVANIQSSTYFFKEDVKRAASKINQLQGIDLSNTKDRTDLHEMLFGKDGLGSLISGSMVGIQKVINGLTEEIRLKQVNVDRIYGVICESATEFSAEGRQHLRSRGCILSRCEKNNR